MKNMISLKSNDNLEVYMFNVGRGLSILIKTPLNNIIIYDLGSSDDLSPISDIYSKNDFFSNMVTLDGKKIAQCLISHPHLDHVLDLTDDNVDFIKENCNLITCQNDKSDNEVGHAINFKRINNPGENVSQIDNYKSLYSDRSLPLRTINPDKDGIDFKMGYYYITHKQANALFDKDNQKYTNSLSIVLYLSYGDKSILIPGDITPEAFKLILNAKCEKRFTDYKTKASEQNRINWSMRTGDQPSLKALITTKRLSLLVAPHHGLESGYPECLFSAVGEKKPSLILISEGKHSEKSGNIDKRYQNGIASNGMIIANSRRYSLTTRNDGNIKIIIQKNNIELQTKSDWKDLFE